MPEGDPSGQRLQRALESALEREKAALRTHDAAAERHRSMQNHYLNAAGAAEGEAADRLRALADSEAQRAQRAQQRAAAVRERLRREGHPVPGNSGDVPSM